MTNKRLTSIVFVFLALAGYALAQTATNMPPANPDVTALPTNAAEFWVLGIAAVTPLIVGGIYKLVPNIPTVLLPASTPVVGIILGALINALSKTHLGWIDMAQAGALAVFLRETFNQAVTKRMQPPTTSVTATGTNA